MAFQHAPDGPGPDKNAAIVFLASKLRVRLLDPDRNPVAGGRCRVAGRPDVSYALDGDGIADIPVLDRSQTSIALEWEAPGGGGGSFPWSNVFDADIRTAGDEDCSRRLMNLGFPGETLPERVDAYLDFLGLNPTGDINPHRNAIVLLHDDGKALARGASRANGGSGSPAASGSHPPSTGNGGPAGGPAQGGTSDAKAIVERLYRAFNDSGFLGLGGTDEEGALGALRMARDKGIMKEVEALYAATYPDEPSLKDEIDDELSGDEFDAAMKLYDEGMKAAPKPRPAAAAGGPASGGATGQTPVPEVPVRGTVVPAVPGIREFRVEGIDSDGNKKAQFLARDMQGSKYGSDRYAQADFLVGKKGSYRSLEFPDGDDYKFWYWGQITPKSGAKVSWDVTADAGAKLLLFANRLPNKRTPQEPIDVTGLSVKTNGSLVGSCEIESDGNYRTFWEADLQLLDADGREIACHTLRLRENYAFPGLEEFTLKNGDTAIIESSNNQILDGSPITVGWKLMGEHSRNGLELRVHKGGSLGEVVARKTVRPLVADGAAVPEANKAATGSTRFANDFLNDYGVYTAELVLFNRDGDVSRKTLVFSRVGSGTGSDAGSETIGNGEFDADGNLVLTTDARVLDHYIDNRVEAVGVGLYLGGYLLFIPGQDKPVFLPENYVDLNLAAATAVDETIHHWRDDANRAVTASKKQNAYAYYDVAYGMVAPTIFSSDSAPRIIDMIMRGRIELKKQVQEELTYLAIGIVGGLVVRYAVNKLIRWSANGSDAWRAKQAKIRADAEAELRAWEAEIAARRALRDKASRFVQEARAEFGKVRLNLGGNQRDGKNSINVNNNSSDTMKNDEEVIPRLLKMDASDIGTVVPPGEVDIVLSNNVEIGHINWEKTVPGAYRVLKPGGTFQVGNFGGLDPAIKPALQKSGFVDIAEPIPGTGFITAKKPGP